MGINKMKKKDYERAMEYLDRISIRCPPVQGEVNYLEELIKIEYNRKRI